MDFARPAYASAKKFAVIGTWKCNTGCCSHDPVCSSALIMWSSILIQLDQMQLYTVLQTPDGEPDFGCVSRLPLPRNAYWLQVLVPAGCLFTVYCIRYTVCKTLNYNTAHTCNYIHTTYITTCPIPYRTAPYHTMPTIPCIRMYLPTYIQTYRHTDMQTCRHAYIQTYRESHTGVQAYGIQAYRHTGVQAYRRTGVRHTGIQAYRRTGVRHTGIETYLQTYRHTRIQTFGHSDIQTFRHTDIQTSRHARTYRHADICRHMQTCKDIQTCTVEIDIQTYRHTDIHGVCIYACHCRSTHSYTYIGLVCLSNAG